MDTSGFVFMMLIKKSRKFKTIIANNLKYFLKVNYLIDKLKLERKIPDIKELVKKTDCNAKIAEIEGKIRSISGIATNVALT